MNLLDSQPKDRKHEPAKELEKQTSNFQPPPFFVNDHQSFTTFTVPPSRFGERKRVPPLVVGCTHQSFANMKEPHSKFRPRERAPLKVSSNVKEPRSKFRQRERAYPPISRMSKFRQYKRAPPFLPVLLSGLGVLPFRPTSARTRWVVCASTHLFKWNSKWPFRLVSCWR